MSALLWVGVGLLGGLGAVARFLVDGAISRSVSTPFPVGTLAVNLLGALVLGVLAGATADSDVLRLVAVGMLGSFTTFSTWMFESQRLAEDGELSAGLANIALSLALGLALAWVGLRLGEML